MNLSEVKPMKAAIIGCGSISDIFFKNFTQRFKIIDLVCCASKGMKSAQSKAEQYGIKACTVDEIMDNPEIELVVNITPAEQHYSIIKRALESGKHVWTEKEISDTSEHSKELYDLAREKGLWLGSEPDHFLGASWQTAREQIDAGIIGDVTSAFVSVSENMNGVADKLRFINEPAGGIGFDFGIYSVTQLVALFGPAKSVCGVMKTMNPTRRHCDVHHPQFGEEYTYINEDFAAGNITFESGVIATLHFNGNSIMEAPSSFMIYGSAGVLSMPRGAEFSGEMTMFRMGNFEPTKVLPVYPFDHDSRGVGAAEMAWAIRTGREPRAAAQLGIHCQEILEGLKISGETGKVYELKSTCTVPKPLPKGYRGMIPLFSYDEEGALVLD